ncbi:hypothetical protein POM88_011165 [Heracleum sosnowskyi]|uniref:Conserved oligomeric Golgi complex subunit 1 n=1 Tax=Heracleum sosnowskyi TaxID=360622 RepID=A0AAD8IU04_9APIA|nr:hypothetical protein POM88_011165 [Heracleum sosnowskyi]
MTKDLFPEVCDLWMSWIVENLSTDLFHNLMLDDNLAATVPQRSSVFFLSSAFIQLVVYGWEETVVKQEQSDERTSEIKISLPSMPSEYITLFLNQACVEVRRAGGHVLDRIILQKFASTCLEKVINIYGDFLSNEEGVISMEERLFPELQKKNLLLKRNKIEANRKCNQPRERERERIDGLINGLAQRLDPVDWLT